jgi:hypothetical protein
MRPRFRFLVLLLTLSLALAASAERRRAVRSGSSNCTFSLTAGYADPVASSGMVRGPVQVAGSAATCTSWLAFSDVSWITIDTAGNTAYLTVLPNTSPDARSARVRIAGRDLQVTQLGHVAPPDPNLLTNGTFDTDLRAWGWLARFPNGTGDATWSSLDANGSASSGSMRLRDDLDSGPAYQQLQCLNVGQGFYDYGAAVRVASRTAARPVLALVEYDARDCAGNYPNYTPRVVTLSEAGVWVRVSYTGTVSSTAKSVSLIIAGWAREPGVQEVWFDDVFLKRRP